MLPLKKYFLRLLLPFFAITVVVYTYLFHYVFNIGLDAAAISAFAIAIIQTLGVWGLYIIISSYPTRVGAITYAVFLGSVLTVIIYFVDTSLLKWLGSERPGYTEAIRAISPVHFIITWVALCWVASGIAALKQINELKKAISRQTDASALLRDAELFKLRQQLQPHFLYNSLNSISALTIIEPVKAQEMIGRLSDFLRSSVKREAQDQSPLDDELSYIEAYLSIESVRFGDRLNVVFEKDYTDDAQIPPFLLQPLLENAIKFGLYGKTGKVMITVQIALQDSMLVITITNPYDPQTNIPTGTGFGLEGVRRRLYLLFARNDLLQTTKDDNIFTTILKIPQTDVQRNTDR